MSKSYPGDVRIAIGDLVKTVNVAAPVSVLAAGSMYATLKYSSRLVKSLNAANVRWSFD